MKLRRFAVLQIIVCNSGVKPHARDEAAQELDRVTHHRDASLEWEEEEYPEEVQGVSDVDSDHFDE